MLCQFCFIASGPKTKVAETGIINQQKNVSKQVKVRTPSCSLRNIKMSHEHSLLLFAFHLNLKYSLLCFMMWTWSECNLLKKVMSEKWLYLRLVVFLGAINNGRREIIDAGLVLRARCSSVRVLVDSSDPSAHRPVVYLHHVMNELRVHVSEQLQTPSPTSETRLLKPRTAQAADRESDLAGKYRLAQLMMIRRAVSLRELGAAHSLKKLLYKWRWYSS